MKILTESLISKSIMVFKINFLITTVMFFSACCSSKNSASNLNESNQKDNSFKKIAEEKFDNNYNIIFNSDSTYLICYSQEKKIQTVFPPLKYFIYNVNKNNIVFEESLPNGKVKWLNDYQVQISTIPGIVKGDENKNNSAVYIYDIKKKRKIKSNLLELNK